MSKKASNPMPPKGAVKPPPPPAPPKRKEDASLEWLMGWSEGPCISIIDQKAKCYGIIKEDI